MTTKQIKGLFAFAVLQNKTMLISNLNTNGYPTALNISNQDLVDKLYSIYIAEGFEQINSIFKGISISQASKNDALALRNSFLPPGSDAASQKTLLETLQELWAGAKDVVGGTEQETQKPVVSPAVAGIVLVIFAALIGVVLWKA